MKVSEVFIIYTLSYNLSVVFHQIRKQTLVFVKHFNFMFYIASLMKSSYVLERQNHISLSVSTTIYCNLSFSAYADLFVILLTDSEVT